MIFWLPNCWRTTIVPPKLALISPSTQASSASAFRPCSLMVKLQPATPRVSFKRETHCSPVMYSSSTPPRTSLNVLSNGAASLAYTSAKYVPLPLVSMVRYSRFG